MAVAVIIGTSQAGSMSQVGSGNADGYTLRPALSFLSADAPVGVFLPSAPQLPRYASIHPSH